FSDNRCGQRMPGVCRKHPTTCPGLVLPACGCDGQVYGNSCYAYMERIDVGPLATCGISSGGSGGGMGGQGGAAGAAGMGGAGGSAGTGGAGGSGPPPCESNGDCATKDYCAFSDDRCSLGVTGSCKPRPTGCPQVSSPVCGCNSITY